MKPIKTILAATDLSAPARHAVERAFSLAALAGSELHILHGLELDALDSLREMLGADLATVKAGMVDNASEQLEQLIASPASPSGVSARARVVIGNPITTIAAEATLAMGARIALEITFGRARTGQYLALAIRRRHLFSCRILAGQIKGF